MVAKLSIVNSRFEVMLWIREEVEVWSVDVAGWVWVSVVADWVFEGEGWKDWRVDRAESWDGEERRSLGIVCGFEGPGGGGESRGAVGAWRRDSQV